MRMLIYLPDTSCGTNANGMHACLHSFYDKTLAALKSSQNERLWFKTNMKLAKLWFDKHEFHRLQVGVCARACVCRCVPSWHRVYLHINVHTYHPVLTERWARAAQRILRELHKSCTTEAGQDDQKKGTQLLELYSLEIQMHTEKKDNKKLRATYEQAMKVVAPRARSLHARASIYACITVALVPADARLAQISMTVSHLSSRIQTKLEFWQTGSPYHGKKQQ